jgi:two-component SAPR family response regulator
MKSYDMFDSFLAQFNIAIQERRRSISRENLNHFFVFCRNFYSTIEHTVKQDVSAVKILVRMIALLPINRDNMMIGSEAARAVASIILNTLSEKLLVTWPTITDAEWSSFREGLVTLCCIKLLHHQVSEKAANDTLNLLPMIPNEEQKQQIAMKLLNLLGDLQFTLPEKQEVALYTLVGENHLTLEHLELATSLETYVSYLIQLVIAHQGDVNELEAKIQRQLDKLLKEKRFPSKKLNKYIRLELESFFSRI